MQTDEITILVDKHYDKININTSIKRYLEKMKTNE